MTREEKRYYTAVEVQQRVKGLNSVSTLNKWANFVQTNCNYQFYYGFISFEMFGKNGRKVRHRKTRMFTPTEIEKFEQVAQLIPKIGRAEALKRVFGKNEDNQVLKSNDRAELFHKDLEKLKEKVDQRLEILNNNQLEMNRKIRLMTQWIQKLERIEENTESETFGGWFRKKR